MFDRYYCIKTENICYISCYFLLIHGFSPVNARLLITCGTAFLCNNAGLIPIAPAEADLDFPIYQNGLYDEVRGEI